MQNIASVMQYSEIINDFRQAAKHIYDLHSNDALTGSTDHTYRVFDQESFKIIQNIYIVLSLVCSPRVL